MGKKHSESDRIKIDWGFYVDADNNQYSMTDFTFTKRDATFVKRFIDLYTEDFKKDIEEKTKMDSDTFKTKLDNMGDYRFRCRRGVNNVFVSLIIKFKLCDDDEDENNIDMKSLEPFIKVMIYHEQYNDTLLYEDHFNIENNEWIDKLIKTYQFCSCSANTLAVKDGYCEQCYPLVMEQEDVCCICLHNEGVWVKLECGHTLHKGCFRNIGDYRTANRNSDGQCVKKCPLCRKEVGWNDYKTI